MQSALHVSDPTLAEPLARKVLASGWRALLLDGGFRAGLEREAYERLLRLAGRALEEAPFTRLMVGHEACEHLLPDLKRWERVLALSDKLGLGLSVVLPPVYAAHEAAVEALLDRLARDPRPALEVVCAEWGAVELVRARPPLRPALGRLMNRMKRFARWSRQSPSPDPGDLFDVDPRALLHAQVEAQRQPAFGGEAFLDLARSAGAVALGVDPVPQGVAGEPPPDLALDLHVPWSYVTSGRRCVTRQVVEGAAADHEAPCRAWCRRRFLVGDYEGETAPIVQKGNAVLLENVAFVGRVAPALRRHARWVITPRL